VAQLRQAAGVYEHLFKVLLPPLFLTHKGDRCGALVVVSFTSRGQPSCLPGLTSSTNTSTPHQAWRGAGGAVPLPVASHPGGGCCPDRLQAGRQAGGQRVGGGQLAGGGC
jgi:hypothetical protein